MKISFKRIVRKSKDTTNIPFHEYNAEVGLKRFVELLKRKKTFGHVDTTDLRQHPQPIIIDTIKKEVTMSV